MRAEGLSNKDTVISLGLERTLKFHQIYSQACVQDLISNHTQEQVVCSF